MAGSKKYSSKNANDVLADCSTYVTLTDDWNLLMKISATDASTILYPRSSASKQSVREAQNHAQEMASPPQRTEKINMRNVSLNEINTLIKAGVDGLLDIMPAVPASVGQSIDDPSAATVKVDFIAQIEAQIAFHETRGERVDFLKQVLSHINALDGMPMPTSIDTRA